MVSELVIPVEREGQINFGGLLSLPSKSNLSDIFFNEQWGTPLIRPLLPQSTSSSNLGKVLSKTDHSFDPYKQKIVEILNAKRLLYPNVVFIDIRFCKDLETDIIINYKNTILDKFIEPVLNNMLMSNWKFSKNIKEDLDLINRVCAPENGVHGYQLLLSEDFLKNKTDNSMKFFEETTIFSHLAITGRI